MKDSTHDTEKENTMSCLPENISEYIQKTRDELKEYEDPAMTQGFLEILV